MKSTISTSRTTKISTTMTISTTSTRMKRISRTKTSNSRPERCGVERKGLPTGAAGRDERRLRSGSRADFDGNSASW